MDTLYLITLFNLHRTYRQSTVSHHGGCRLFCKTRGPVAFPPKAARIGRRNVIYICNCCKHKEEPKLFGGDGDCN